MNHRPGRRLAALACIATAAGCISAGSPRATPKVAVPTTWSHASAGAAADDAALAGWWRSLGDPALSHLIERAIAANLDVQSAVARVREARARRGLASAQRGPSVSQSSTIDHTWSPDTNTTRYTQGLDVTWDADVFGAQRAAVDAAGATVQARIEDARDVLVGVVAEVALEYVEVTVGNTRLQTAADNVAAQEATLEIAGYRYRAGLATEIDVQQATANLEQTRATLPTLRVARDQALNRLSILLGEPPGRLDAAIRDARATPVAPVAIAIGIPADVLRRRPDVRRAERELAAQIAEVRSANRAKYPSLSLSGSIGLEALSAGDLMSAAARVLTAGLRVTQPLFDSGKIRRTIEIQNALQEQAALAYETRVLAALAEVENTLVAFAEEQVHRTALQAAADAAQQAAALAQEQYRSGLVDFQVVLSAQQTLRSAQDALAVSTGEIAASAVRLYKAAGGGWSTASLAEAA